MANQSLDACHKCGEPTWRMKVYLHVTAPASLVGNLPKKSFRRNDVKTAAVLWETMSWYCANPKCCHFVKGTSQVRIEPRDRSESGCL